MVKKYARDDWQRLGHLVQAARLAEGWDTQEWSEIVGRSDRVLLGLERGEPVGQRTLRLIEDALGWDAGEASRALAGHADPPSQRARGGTASPEDLSDEQLLAEVARRFARTVPEGVTVRRRTRGDRVESLAVAPSAPTTVSERK